MAKYLKLLNVEKITGVWYQKMSRVIVEVEEVADRGSYKVLNYPNKERNDVYVTYDVTEESTLEEYEAQFEFKLPEKWYVKVTNEQSTEEIAKFFNISNYPSSSGYWAYLSTRLVSSALSTFQMNTARIPEEFIEISFDNFIKYVLNGKENHKPKEDLNYLVYLLKNKGIS